MVLGELPCGKFHRGKFPLVKLPRGKFPFVKLPRGKFLSGIFPEESSPAENYPVFINAFFIHHSLKMKRELVIA